MMSYKGHHPSFISLYSFFFGSPHTALFWPVDMDMDEVIREDMAQAVQIWRKKGKKKRKYKNSKGKHAYNHNFAFIQFRYNG